MKQRKPLHESAPFSQRSAKELSRRYHHPDLSSFAAALPEGAEVADVGAGRSPLGLRVCYLRPDIRWTNVDARYARPRIYRRMVKSKPDNLEFVPGNALSLTEQFGRERFDRMFSYYLLPHLTLDDRELGLKGAANMLDITKSAGKAAIGPCVALAGSTLQTMVIEMSDYDPNDRELLVEEIVTATTLSPIDAIQQRVTNMHNALFDRFSPFY